MVATEVAMKGESVLMNRGLASRYRLRVPREIYI